MAMDMFIKLTNIKGEAQDKTYKGSDGWNDLLAWSWGCSQSGTTHVGGGGGGGKVNCQDLSVTKWLNNASPDLIKACCKGTHIEKVEIVVRKAGDTPLDYLKITLEEVIVSSVSTGGSGGEDRLTENVSLNFAKIHYLYTEQSKKGAAGASPEVKWNIPENAPY